MRVAPGGEGIYCRRPINRVVPPLTATRWAEVLMKVPNAGEALASIGRSTGDPTRDLAAATRASIRAKLPDSLLGAFDGEDEGDQGTLDRMFGEALPSGLILSATRESGAP